MKTLDPGPWSQPPSRPNPQNVEYLTVEESDGGGDGVVDPDSLGSVSQEVQDPVPQPGAQSQAGELLHQGLSSHFHSLQFAVGSSLSLFQLSVALGMPRLQMFHYLTRVATGQNLLLTQLAPRSGFTHW